MNIGSSKVLGSIMIEKGNMLKNGECELDDDEVIELAMMLLHRKLYIEQICNIYGMSARTLERAVEKKEFPKFRKEPSGKKFMWQDEIELFIYNRNKKLNEESVRINI